MHTNIVLYMIRTPRLAQIHCNNVRSIPYVIIYTSIHTHMQPKHLRFNPFICPPRLYCDTNNIYIYKYTYIMYIMTYDTYICEALFYVMIDISYHHYLITCRIQYHMISYILLHSTASVSYTHLTLPTKA